MFLFSGCYMNASITSLTPSVETPLPTFSKITSIENVIGSNNYQITAVSGFKVRQSAGLLINKQLMTTPLGYRVYTHINGRITSQELDE
jgi:hypothetical protein